jgi:deazaflavin-dependent oxidoreductase (nitroreductase family)
MSDLLSAADEDFCYLTTIGRVSGRPHEIEIWFALDAGTLYMLAGSGMNADWVKNLQRNSQVSVRIAGAVYAGAARIVADAAEDALARRLVVEKYQPRDSDDLTDWGRTALPVAVELAS